MYEFICLSPSNIIFITIKTLWENHYIKGENIFCCCCCFLQERAKKIHFKTKQPSCTYILHSGYSECEYTLLQWKKGKFIGHFLCCSVQKKRPKEKNTPKREDNFWDRSGYAKQPNNVCMCCIMFGHIHFHMSVVCYGNGLFRKELAHISSI